MGLLKSIQLQFSCYKIKKSTSKIAWSGPKNFGALTGLPEMQIKQEKSIEGSNLKLQKVAFVLKTWCIKCTWFCRCWVLLDANYNVYLYEEGVLRTASESYQRENLDDVTSHLTNHCLQKELSANFGMYEEGNEMFFSSFDRQITQNILPTQITLFFYFCGCRGKIQML